MGEMATQRGKERSPQYLSGFGEKGKGGPLKGIRGRGKGKEKTFTLYPVGELVEPLTFSQNQIPS
ncbi:hypothetical protein VF14_06230 [Nostoc linckia z18]|uniref:Uncharacterized protein n=2 Tax=Nostoc linckia TaxID=92942 RepID=A0A9Q6EKX0_NOSLI|nr:hypothetical protein VF05_33000 [Nostoc linckia z3]PHJ63108.1 hypothetical protein VF02_15815 [Nostoc linckia z1]PHJ75731.1 hypothetical protein VF03_09815 [Nostoc linckia z2]PHJ85341.1 hypothetical protein VF06_07125 [Nostoc linckia z4]PHJ89664.1 hypothetical protein VF07_11690 [Nostoc linckia z6]PHJ90332.1 hypothetical protein VF04_30995 [Nostoc linckia z7]PHK02754.1 hypothetical protein VF08_17650 [Nostoc linckia z8]PHK10109.1 hypothetical protein VF09_12640 [Nostoc linckia z9]PHK2300